MEMTSNIAIGFALSILGVVFGILLSLGYRTYWLSTLPIHQRVREHNRYKRSYLTIRLIAAYSCVAMLLFLTTIK